MDSPEPISRRLLSALLPSVAVFREDVRQSLRHWATVSWLVLSLGLTLVWLVSVPAPTPSIAAHRWEDDARPVSHRMVEDDEPAPLGPTAARAAAKLLRAHLLLWATFVVALGATAIAGEAEIAGDAILSRGIGRWQYFLAKMGARVAIVLTVFFVASALSLALVAFRMPNDLTIGGSWQALKSVGSMLAIVTVLSVACGSWFSQPLLAVAVTWMGIYGLAISSGLLGNPSWAPTALADRLLPLLQGQAIASSLVGPPPMVVAITCATGLLISIIAYSRRDLA